MRNRDLWREWEDDVAYLTDGDIVKASGATDYAKGDVKTSEFLIDAKETRSDGFSVKDDFWSKLSTWARNEGREPAIAIRIYGESSTYEVAVVNEMSYAERHADYEPDDQLKKQRQKRVTCKMSGKKPTQFLVGKYRLVAYSFDEFCKDARHDEGR